MSSHDVTPDVSDRAGLVQQILSTAHSAFVLMSEVGDIMEWNPAAETTFGWSREEAMGRDVAGTIIPERLREAHWRGLERFLETGEGPVLNHQFEIMALHRDGHEFPIEMTIAPLSLHGRFMFSAFLQDITQRRWLERSADAQRAVLRAVVSAQSAAEASHGLLRALGETLSWDVGVYWRADESLGRIRCEEIWSAPGVADQWFEEVTRDTTFAPGEGMPGRTWQSGDATWVDNVLEDPRFLRLESAADAGLHAAVYLPVTDGGHVIGVVEFFSRELWRPDRALDDLALVVSESFWALRKRESVERSPLA